ncbi:MAG: nitrite reductase small subunit NirD [Gammaproteobacteria bacterium]
MSWVDVGPENALPARGARTLKIGSLQIAVFRTGAGEVFALRDHCPHRGGPLSQGIVHGSRVTCPLHEWVIDLKTGRATGVDEGCTPNFPVRIVNDRVEIDLPASAEARVAALGPPPFAVCERA